MMGTGVGLTIGFIFGSYSILRYVCNNNLSLTVYSVLACRGGAGPRGVLSTLSQYMLSSAATFGFFLSIGSVRTSSHLVCFIHQIAFRRLSAMMHHHTGRQLGYSSRRQYCVHGMKASLL